MKILVPVKRVVDYNVRIRIKSDGSGIETANVKMSMNPFDEIAIEEAVRQKETGAATEVVAVTCGVDKSQDVLRTAMAIGADRGILVKTDAQLTPLMVAKILKKIAEKEQPDLVILGKQATDDDAGQTGQMLASLLNAPQATAVSKLEPAEGKVTAIEEVDDGQKTVQLSLPAVVTVDLRLNEPRYVTLPNMMKARKKTIEQTTPEELDVSIESKLKVLKVSEPAARSEVQMVPDVGTLVSRLKNEAKVI